jgi:hypothetical protein
MMSLHLSPISSSCSGGCSRSHWSLSNGPVLFGRFSVEWAHDAFSLRRCTFLWLKINRLRVAGRGRAEAVPRDRCSGFRCTRNSGVQPFPNAQQLASISAATSNAMHLEIIVIVRRRGNQDIISDLALVRQSIQKPSSAMPIQLNANIEQTIAAANDTGSRSFCLLFL